MSVISKGAKAKLGMGTAKTLAKNPGMLRTGVQMASPAAKLGFEVAKPMMKRQTRRRIEQLAEQARSAGTAVAVYVPQAAEALGLIEPPKPKRTAPRVVAGVLIGATAMYFLEPGAGAKHREQLAGLVG